MNLMRHLFPTSYRLLICRSIVFSALLLLSISIEYRSILAEETTFDSNIRQSQIEQLLKEKEGVLALLEKTDQEEWSVLAIISGINNYLRNSYGSLQKLRTDIRDASQDVQFSISEVEKLQLQIESDRESINQQLLNMFRFQKIRQKTLLPGQGQFDHYFRNQRLIAMLTHLDSNRIQRLQENIIELELRKEEREKQLFELSELELTEQETIRNLRLDLRLQKNYLRQVRNDQNRYKKYLAEIENESRQIKKLLQTIEKSPSPVKATREDPISIGLRQNKGNLFIPFSGNLVQSFGADNNSKYPLLKRGIVITSPDTSEVFAVLHGKVVFKGPFHNFGEILIIDHGKGSFSVYGNLKESFTKVNQQIKRGQKLGIVQYEPAENKNLLYLELRYGGRSVDPVPWFTKNTWK